MEGIFWLKMTYLIVSNLELFHRPGKLISLETKQEIQN